ncbi:MAG: ABC transporter ATP-binding protein [Betaproteobacteria bacterium]|nr:ABC transporter ATP-binding protein [Betaproteobacteria bacterium]
MAERSGICGATTTNLTFPRKLCDLLLRSERLDLVTLLLLMLVGMVLEMLGVGIVLPAILLITRSDIGDTYPILQTALNIFGNPSQELLITSFLLALLGLYLGKNIFVGFLAWRQAHFSFGLHNNLSQRLFMLYMRQPYAFHLQRNSAQLIQNLVVEIPNFTHGCILPGLILVAEMLVLFGLGGLLLVVQPIGAAFVACALGFAAWGFHHFTRNHVVRWGAMRQYHEGLRIQHLQQGLGSAKDVKLLGRESEFFFQHEFHSGKSARVGELHHTVVQLPRLMLELLAVAGLVALVLIMLGLGHALADILPTMGLFAAAASRLIPSVNRLLSSLQTIKFNFPVIDRLHSEFNLPQAETISPGAALGPFQSTLEIDGVYYTYVGAERHSLYDVCLTIRQGESVGFIGSSGAGKSTLVDILLGLLTPDRGQIRVDGQNVQQHLRAWQDQIGYVPQSIFLTDDTIRRNIAFGIAKESIDEVALQRAIRSAQLQDFVKTLSEGLETVVGERGIRLSGGQLQRIGIARALYHDPSVLVLDEATSALDSAAERRVMEAVRNLRGTKTIIIVTHRLSTIQFCDRLYRLEDGRLVSQGRPE